jgi:hypothetical protein
LTILILHYDYGMTTHQTHETRYSHYILGQAEETVGFYSDEADLQAATVGLLASALELALSKQGTTLESYLREHRVTIEQEQNPDIYGDLK